MSSTTQTTTAAGQPRPARQRRTLLTPFGLTGAGRGRAPQRPGAVFSLSEHMNANSITTFAGRRRDADHGGVGPTGGRGTGGPRTPQRAVLANVNGETSPTNTKGRPKFLLALNGGSDSITVLRNDPAGLTGRRHRGLAGHAPDQHHREPRRRLRAQRRQLHVHGVGEQPSISGFTFDADGQLTPIPGSTRPLSGAPNSGCTQVSFDKTGKVVIVDEQQADVITTYTRQRRRHLSAPMPQQTTGNGPFGLTLTQRNQLLTTENFGAVPARVHWPRTPSTSGPARSRR
jgi:hypothetical protein